MPDLPEPAAGWPAIPLIETTSRVLGGLDGPANAQALALAARADWLKAGLEAATAALTTAQSRIATSEATADAAMQEAAAAALAADTAEDAATAAALTAATASSTAGAAQMAATMAQTAASAADTKATAAQTTAGTADSKATTAQTMAGTANTNASAAVSTADAASAAVATKATRIDLGTVSLTYSAAIILGAGARSVQVACSGAQVNDAVFVAATGAVPDGYAVGAAQCLTAGQIRVSIVHPALALGASFTIPLRVFVLR